MSKQKRQRDIEALVDEAAQCGRLGAPFPTLRAMLLEQRLPEERFKRVLKLAARAYNEATPLKKMAAG